MIIIYSVNENNFVYTYWFPTEEWAFDYILILCTSKIQKKKNFYKNFIEFDKYIDPAKYTSTAFS